MNIRKNVLKILSGALLLVGFAQAASANQITLTNASGPQGGTLVWEIRFEDQNTASSTLQFTIGFNSTVFSLNDCTVNNPGDWVFPTCQIGGAGELDFATLDPPPGPVVGGGGDATLMATVTFDIIGGPPGVYNTSVISSIVTSDGEVTNVDGGDLEVLGASYDSNNPEPGVAINMAGLTSDPNQTHVMDIVNDGEAGTTLNGSCSLGGADPSAFQVSGTPWSTDQGGAAAQVTLTCLNSTLAPGNYNTIMSCTHDGDTNPTSPVGYAVSCSVTGAPSPEYGSNPAAGALLDFGTWSTTDPAQDIGLTIENVGTADGLDGACSITTNPNGAYSIDSAAAYGPLAQAATAGRTVTCDTSILGDHSGGVLSCTHNGSFGSPASPVNYPLSCVIEPTPEYDSTPAVGGNIDLGDYPQNNTPTNGSLTITNVGETGSDLTGTCSMVGATAISIVGSGTYSAGVGSPANIALTCDTSQAQGNYVETLSCTHNDGDGSVASPADYTVECDILPPDPAVYASTPAPGSTLDMTPGDPVPAGGAVADVTLTIENAAPAGDDFLDLQGCSITAGDPEITANPVTESSDLDPGASTDVVFSCDTTNPSSPDGLTPYSATYTCDYDTSPSTPVDATPDGGGVGQATYTVECAVRDPYSEVEVTPPAGTPQTAELMPGESTTFSFTFDEIVDEGFDASLDDCSVAGPDFAVTAPGSFPQTIPSGGSVQVDVTFTDPGVGDTFTDTLNCTYTDSPEPDGGTLVSWPLEVTVVGRNATFTVTKDFDDDNPAGVEVTLECNTGLPLQQTGTVYDPDSNPGPGQFTELEFVVVDFNPGDMDCDIAETVPVGYTPFYFADIGDNGVAGSVTDDETGCHYDGIESADFICEISNELDLVEIVVNKEWIDDNPGYDLPTIVDITIWCTEPVFGIGGPVSVDSANQANGGYYSWGQFIDPTFPGTFGIYPHWDGSTECFVTEEPEAGVDADVSDCADISVAPGVGAECTVVNTRLYAGIPTLSQYGLILMALLMLGVGAVAFRRYS